MPDLNNTDPRLTWLLRVLADEFGALGVASTVRQMWPEAFTAAARDDVTTGGDPE